MNERLHTAGDDLNMSPKTGPWIGITRAPRCFAQPARVQQARQLVTQATQDVALPNGGFAYTLENGQIAKSNRYWWPVT